MQQAILRLYGLQGTREVNAANTSPEFRAYIGRALELLRTSDTEVGQRTYAFIARGGARRGAYCATPPTNFGGSVTVGIAPIAGSE